MNRLIIIAGAGALAAAAGVATLWIVQSRAVQSPAPVATSPTAARSDRAEPRGSQVRQEAFGDWLLVCPEAAAQPCSAVQRQVRSEDGQAVFAVTMRPADGASREIAFLTPLGVLLEPGVELRIAGDPALRARFTQCQPGQCRAVATLDIAVEARLGAADRVSAAFRLAGGREIDIAISVDGLVPVVDALDATAGR